MSNVGLTLAALSMKHIFQVVVLFAWLFTVPAYAERTIPYEPATVVLNGTIHEAKFEHPNGTWVRFLYLKLPESVRVGDAVDSPFNVEESGVTEVQIVGDKPGVRRLIRSFVGKRVQVSGSVFHAHTAWHVRKLVVDVVSLAGLKPNKSFNPDALKNAGQ